MSRCTSFLLIWLSLFGIASAGEIPLWVGEVSVTPADAQGFATVSLGGVWRNSCVPGGITHEIDDKRIQLDVVHPGSSKVCLTVLTPWSLEHRVGPLEDGAYSIFGSLYGFNLRDPDNPRLESGPDLLVALYKVDLPPPPLADLTDDRFVDFDDLATLLTNWNLDGATIAQGNFVQPDETTINFDDLAFLLTTWTGPPPVMPATAAAEHAIPEPSAFVLAVLALLAACMWQGRRCRCHSH